MSAVPKGGSKDRPICMWVCLWRGIEFTHRFVRYQAARMHVFVVVTLVPSPDMRRIQHRRRPVVADPLIQCGLAIVLPFGGAEPVRTKIGRMPGYMVSIFMINDARVMRGVRAISRSLELDERTRIQQLPSRAEMD